MHCTHCGTKAQDGDNYCAKCGTKLRTANQLTSGYKPSPQNTQQDNFVFEGDGKKPKTSQTIQPTKEKRPSGYGTPPKPTPGHQPSFPGQKGYKPYVTPEAKTSEKPQYYQSKNEPVIAIVAVILYIFLKLYLVSDTTSSALNALGYITPGTAILLTITGVLAGLTAIKDKSIFWRVFLIYFVLLALIGIGMSDFIHSNVS